MTVLATSLVLSGCVTAYVAKATEEETEELSRTFVVAANPAPDAGTLAGVLGPPSIEKISDLRVNTYDLDVDSIVALHRASGGKEKGVTVGEVVGITAAEVLLYPLIPLDYIALAVMTADDDSRKKAAADRKLVVVSDADGNYRWQLCCPRQQSPERHMLSFEDIPEPRFLEVEQRADDPLVRQRTRSRYIPDYWAIACHHAKEGDLDSAELIFRAYRDLKNEGLPIEAYWWARQVWAEDDLSYQPTAAFTSLQKAMTPAQRAAARALHRQRSLSEVDCRLVADNLTTDLSDTYK